ncbi:MAG: hydroxymethylpyrimidine/phosphomethylpyrimidine kinase, partial [Gammaproteobacteria bacterium]
EPVSADLLAQQIVALETHFRIRAIKLGVPGRVLSQKVLEVLPEQVPLIVDPVLSAGGGGELASSSDRYWPQLLARTTLLTPNPSEALKLADAHSVEAAAARLLGMGVAHVLVTGGDAPTEQVINTLYGPVPARWTLDRFQGRYRGTGCTLASAIAAGLAHGKTLPDSIEAAQRWVSRSLEGAASLTPEVWLPDRRPGI